MQNLIVRISESKAKLHQDCCFRDRDQKLSAFVSQRLCLCIKNAIVLAVNRIDKLLSVDIRPIPNCLFGLPTLPATTISVYHLDYTQMRMVANEQERFKQHFSTISGRRGG